MLFDFVIKSEDILLISTALRQNWIRLSSRQARWKLSRRLRVRDARRKRKPSVINFVSLACSCNRTILTWSPRWQGCTHYWLCLGGDVIVKGGQWPTKTEHKTIKIYIDLSGITGWSMITFGKRHVLHWMCYSAVPIYKGFRSKRKFSHNKRWGSKSKQYGSAQNNLELYQNVSTDSV